MLQDILDQVIREREEEVLRVAERRVMAWRGTMVDNGSTVQSVPEDRAKELLEAQQRSMDSLERERWASHLLSRICVASHT